MQIETEGIGAWTSGVRDVSITSHNRIRNSRGFRCRVPEWRFTQIDVLIVSDVKACRSVHMMTEVHRRLTAQIPGVISNREAGRRSSVANVLLRHALLAKTSWHIEHSRWVTHGIILHMGC